MYLLFSFYDVIGGKGSGDRMNGPKGRLPFKQPREGETVGFFSLKKDGKT